MGFGEGLEAPVFFAKLVKPDKINREWGVLTTLEVEPEKPPIVVSAQKGLEVKLAAAHVAQEIELIKASEAKCAASKAEAFSRQAMDQILEAMAIVAKIKSGREETSTKAQQALAKALVVREDEK
ncbi:hypothetical protein ACLOJK_030485 [Asimina triloba]